MDDVYMREQRKRRRVLYMRVPTSLPIKNYKKKEEAFCDEFPKDKGNIYIYIYI